MQIWESMSQRVSYKLLQLDTGDLHRFNIDLEGITEPMELLGLKDHKGISLHKYLCDMAVQAIKKDHEDILRRLRESQSLEDFDERERPLVMHIMENMFRGAMVDTTNFLIYPFVYQNTLMALVINPDELADLMLIPEEHREMFFEEIDKFLKDESFTKGLIAYSLQWSTMNQQEPREGITVGVKFKTFKEVDDLFIYLQQYSMEVYDYEVYKLKTSYDIFFKGSDMLEQLLLYSLEENDVIDSDKVNLRYSYAREHGKNITKSLSTYYNNYVVTEDDTESQQTHKMLARILKREGIILAE